MARIAVLDDWQGVAAELVDWSAVTSLADVEFFRAPIGDENAVAHALAGFDAIVAMRERTAFPASLIRRLTKLRMLVFTGARNAAVDVEACTRHGVTVCNTGGTRNSAGTAELTLALMLAAARGIPRGDAEIRAGRFQEQTRPGMEMKDRTLGVLGLGKIGGQMARYGHVLGMQVIAWSPNLTIERAAAEAATLVTKDELFERSDVISLHIVLSDRSRGIVGAAEIDRMKPGAILVNTSRGPLIEAAPLLAALHAGRITAALDVYEIEPLDAGAPLRSAPNTVLSPHLGYVTQENMTELYRDCVDDLLGWLEGTPRRVVNPNVLAKAAI